MVVPSVVAACVAAALVVEPAVAVAVQAAVEPSGVAVAWAVAPEEAVGAYLSTTGTHLVR